MKHKQGTLNSQEYVRGVQYPRLPYSRLYCINTTLNGVSIKLSFHFTISRKSHKRVNIKANREEIKFFPSPGSLSHASTTADIICQNNRDELLLRDIGIIWVTGRITIRASLEDPRKQLQVSQSKFPPRVTNKLYSFRKGRDNSKAFRTTVCPFFSWCCDPLRIS